MSCVNYACIDLLSHMLSVPDEDVLLKGCNYTKNKMFVVVAI